MYAVLAISVGSLCGALLRWQLGLWLSSGAVLLPWGTLAANLIGGYLIGICIGVFQHLPHLDPLWRLLLVTGFLGGLTTFSSFSAEVVTMMMQARWLLAAGTVLLHVCGSFLLTWVGVQTVAALWPVLRG